MAAAVGRRTTSVWSSPSERGTRGGGEKSAMYDCVVVCWRRAANAYIMVSPKNTTAMEGTRVRLVCEAEAHPNNITYQWFRDGVDVHLVTGLMARAGIYGDGSFIISSVQRSDTGWYRCQPTNGLGPPPSADAFLNVTCE